MIKLNSKEIASLIEYIIDNNNYLQGIKLMPTSLCIEGPAGFKIKKFQ